MPYHELLTEQMAEIVGAKPIETVVMNSLTVNLHLLMVFIVQTAKETKLSLKKCLSVGSIRGEITNKISRLFARKLTARTYSRQNETTLRSEDILETIRKTVKKLP